MSERARARTLLDALGKGRAAITADAAGELVKSERAAVEKLSDKADALTRLLMGKRAEAQTESARREVEAATIELQANLTQPQPATLAEIQPARRA